MGNKCIDFFSVYDDVTYRKLFKPHKNRRKGSQSISMLNEQIFSSFI